MDMVRECGSLNLLENVGTWSVGALFVPLVFVFAIFNWLSRKFRQYGAAPYLLRHAITEARDFISLREVFNN